MIERLRNFVRWYNEEHMHSGINFVTPASRHAGVDKKIFEKRDEIYQQAKKSRLERWSGKTRNWRHMSEVFLNCLKGKTNADTKSAA
jgi:putative transposase